MKRRAVMTALAAGMGAVGLSGCSPLTAFNALVPKDGGVTKSVVDSPYGSHPRQRLDVYRPRSAARDLPIIVFFYGGSWKSGSKDGYSWLGRALAARGFVVAIPDYRLVPEGRYPAFVEDGAAAVKLVEGMADNVGGDPRKIVIAGHSAGAHIAAMLAYDDQWLGASHRNVAGFMGLAGPYDFLPITDGATRDAFAGTRNLKATQPVNFVGKGDPPAFIATADEDRTVHWKNSDSLAAKLTAAGIPVVRKRYPGVGHAGLVTAIAKPLRGRARVLDDMTTFANSLPKAR